MEFGPILNRDTARSHSGLVGEQDSLRHLQALVVSRITYGPPYLGLRKSEKDINGLFRKTYKLALGLPPATSTERVMQLGVYNLWEEMVEAHKTSQLEEGGHFSSTMYGFRPHLSTQDVLLQLKEEVIDNLSSRSKSIILALDVKGAFDNVSHGAVRRSLQGTG
ncbi:hypothetical protein HPB47_026458 [Ixodes persulcatus]|uniref:Uncharacterized protein n=1 Tax=Ixodes persulcatus TaxID=34615 RepID=A0AC60Q133_IXOPE|nr:hypothetical protein HPB47_026458 [Ixodes persulcatus]